MGTFMSTSFEIGIIGFEQGYLLIIKFYGGKEKYVYIGDKTRISVTNTPILYVVCDRKIMCNDSKDDN